MYKFRAFPHLLLFRNSSRASIIEKDIIKWIRIRSPKRSGYPILENLVWLLKVYPEFRNLFYFRIGSFASIKGSLLLVLAKRLYRPVSTLRFFMLSIGPGFFIRNGFGTILEAREIGENCLVEQMVTIGHKDGNTGVPTIGNNVNIGAGSKILGPVVIGDNVIIGANAIVIKSVPANCTVAGVPAHIIKRNGVKLKKPLPLSDTLV